MPKSWELDCGGVQACWQCQRIVKENIKYIAQSRTKAVGPARGDVRACFEPFRKKCKGQSISLCFAQTCKLLSKPFLHGHPFETSCRNRSMSVRRPSYVVRISFKMQRSGLRRLAKSVAPNSWLCHTMAMWCAQVKLAVGWCVGVFPFYLQNLRQRSADQRWAQWKIWQIKLWLRTTKSCLNLASMTPSLSVAIQLQAGTFDLVCLTTFHSMRLEVFLKKECTEQMRCSPRAEAPQATRRKYSEAHRVPWKQNTHRSAPRSWSNWRRTKWMVPPPAYKTIQHWFERPPSSFLCVFVHLAIH